MAIVLHTPTTHELGAVVDSLRSWQRDGLPLQLHPGDVGWFWRFGATAVAAAVRTWSRDGEILAVGLLDGADLLRMTVAPGLEPDSTLAQAILSDIIDPERGVLVAGEAYVEAPEGTIIKDLLTAAGWALGESWTPLRRDLTATVEEPRIRTVTVDSRSAQLRADLQRASFDQSIFTAEAWHSMAGGPAYADARCLIGFDGENRAVAAITVWAAGAGRPGLIEPMGVHRDHRGLGYGRDITLAGAVALRELGASSALVCTRSDNSGGIATYRSAGFEPQEIRTDRSRVAT